MRMGLLREGGLWCSLYRDAGLVKIASGTETRLRWCERLDDAALGDDGAVPAPADHLIQFMAESQQIGELAIHLGQVLSGNRVYRGGSRCSFCQPAAPRPRGPDPPLTTG